MKNKEPTETMGNHTNMIHHEAFCFCYGVRWEGGNVLFGVIVRSQKPPEAMENETLAFAEYRRSKKMKL